MASQISDNFEAYSVADLQGQGSWTGPAGKFDVVSSPTQSGSRAVNGTAPGGTNGCFRAFTGVQTGTQVIWLNHNHDAVGVQVKMVLINTNSPTTTDYTLNGSAQISLRRAAATDLRCSIAPGDNSETGRIDVPGGTGLSFGTWYKCEIEWDSTLGTYGQFRGRISDGTWSAWVDTVIAVRFDASPYIAGLCLAQNDSSTPTTVYYDDLGEAVAAATSNFLLMGV